MLGVAEASFLPGMIVYLTHWFRYSDRAKAVAVFFAANPLSYVIGSPIAGVLLGISWFGLRGWRWLFVLEGIPAVVLGIIAVFYLTDWPRQAKWLPEDERAWIAEELEREKQAKQGTQRITIWQALRQRDVLLLTLSYLGATSGGYGIGFWLPTIVKRLSGQSDLRVNLIVALPYIVGLLAQQVNAWHSDNTCERRLHAAIAIFGAGVSLLFAVFFGTNLVLAVCLFSLVCAGYFSYHPAFWAVPTAFLSESAAAASIGLINSLGNLGGFFGPWVVGYLVNRTHSFKTGLLYLVANLCVSAILMLAIGSSRRRPVVL